MRSGQTVLIYADHSHCTRPWMNQCAVAGASLLPYSQAPAVVDPPNLMILAASGWTGFAAAVQSLKKFWPEAPALAVFELEPPDDMPGLSAGIDDFLLEPVRTSELLARIQRLLPASERGGTGSETLEAFKAKHHLQKLVGSAESFERSLRKIPLLARADATVLISGETGSGKELVARALHYAGPRASGPFVPCNCAAVPDHLFENELFGHSPGAYTDARGEQKGLLSMAEGGTLFLDEINSLSLAAQAKLLRFLQDHEYRPLGSQHLRRANVRVLAATNADLPALLKTHQFREDLYHRLNVLQIQTPALRDRADDIPVLANLFLRRHCANLERPTARFSLDALAALQRYHWPGNVRELESVVQRAAVLAESCVLTGLDLGLPTAPEPPARARTRFDNAKQAAIDCFEKTYLTNLLTEVAGNVSCGARKAGTERRTFQRLMRKHGLCSSSFQP